MSGRALGWGSGELVQSLTPPAGVGPVREVGKKQPRDLSVQRIQMALYIRDGRWAVGAVALYGMWLRRSDGWMTGRGGSIFLTTPLSEEEGAPEWLVKRVAKLLAALDRAYEMVRTDEDTT